MPGFRYRYKKAAADSVEKSAGLPSRMGCPLMRFE
jgi:hypothetical protein